MTETTFSRQVQAVQHPHADDDLASVSLQRTSSEEKDSGTLSPSPPPAATSISISISSPGGTTEKLSLVQRLSTHSYGQAREMIAKEMRENKEAIARLEARIETLVSILHQAGVELPPYPKPKE